MRVKSVLLSLSSTRPRSARRVQDAEVTSCVPAPNTTMGTPSLRRFWTHTCKLVKFCFVCAMKLLRLIEDHVHPCRVPRVPIFERNKVLAESLRPEKEESSVISDKTRGQ